MHFFMFPIPSHYHHQRSDSHPIFVMVKLKKIPACGGLSDGIPSHVVPSPPRIALENSLPNLCAPKAKLPTLNYWFQAKVSFIFENPERMKKSVQLNTSTPGKRKSILSAKKDFLFRNSTSFIAYWETVCEYARRVRYVVASFRPHFLSQCYQRLLLD